MSKARRPALATVRGFEVHALKAPGPSRIGVLVGGRLVALDIGSIDCVEASGNHAQLHVERLAYVITHRMHSLERMLPRSDFVQIRRSIIANIHRITELHRDADGSGTAVLDGGVRLRVARVRWDALQGALRPERC